MWLARVLLVLCGCLEATLAARILGLFPTPSISHQVVFRALVHELARRGHELVVFTTDPARLHPNITEIDAHDASYPVWDEQFMRKIFEAERSGRRSTLDQYKIFSDFQVNIFDIHMSLPEVQKLIHSKDEHFDLILVESLSRSMFAFRHKFKVPVIAVSSFSALGYTYDAIGVPTHPLLYPDVSSRSTENFGLTEKVVTIYEYLCRHYYDKRAMQRINNLARKFFGEDIPDVTELEAQTDMLFLNVNPMWDGIRPTPPNVFYMWGGHLKPAQELPSELKIFMDNSSRGVAYMSLGSNMKSSELSPDRLNVFVEAFRQLPYDVLWKWETEELPDRPDNVHIAKWLPQADLLRHPNLKVFITQGGLQSTDEAIQAGVPIVGIPMFGDQEANAERYETHGVGVSLNIKTLTAAELRDTIKTVAQSERYRAAVRRMSRLLADEGVAGGVERAAWWVEYVLRHGGAQHLRSPAAGVSAARYFMLDVVAVLVLIVTVSFVFFIAAVYFVHNLFKSTHIRLVHKTKKQ